jgi:3-ketosteroid 9alpha-monooxygenase subunit A
MGTMNQAAGHRSAVAPPAGWQLLALADELTEPVTGLSLGPRALVAIRGERGIRVFDGTCPHRGAHLGYGGRAAGERGIICPFHGKRIGLGTGSGRLCVQEHETIDGGGALFTKLSDIPARDHGFGAVLAGLLSTHRIVAAMTGRAAVPPELIIENAFDFSHFPTVHLIPRLARPKVWLGDGGELNITTAFYTHAPDWEMAEGEFASQFHARAFNPYLVVSELGSADSRKFVITGATPAPAGCVVRIAIAVPLAEPENTVGALIEGSRQAFKEDLPIWDNLDISAPAVLDSSDAPVLAFRAFCASFTSAAGDPAWSIR